VKAEKIFDQTFTARNFNTSPLTISGLEGDLYDYKILFWCDAASGDSIMEITLNSDTGSNYRNYEMKGLSTTASAAVGDSDTAIELQNLLGTANPNLLMMAITGSSGDERYIDSMYAADGAILKQSSYWTNTADAIDEITFTAASSVTADAHIIVYRTLKEASQEKWELMEKQIVSSQNINGNATPVNFTLDGDSDITYKIDVEGSYDSTALDLGFQLNSDTSSNYKKQSLRNNGTIGAQNFNDSYGEVQRSPVTTNLIASSLIINAESGVKRLITSTSSAAASTGNRQLSAATWWDNTGSNLISIDIGQFQVPATSTPWTGSIKLYRSRNPKTIGETLPFEMVEEVAVSGDFSAGHTFSGLSGDDVTLYKIEGLFSTVGNDLRLQLDGDTGSNYEEQYLKGVSSTASAATTTTTFELLCDASASKVAYFEYYLYTISGENRPSLLRVGHGEDSVELKAHWWNNTADEINSIKVYASSTTTCTGTLKLSRLI